MKGNASGGTEVSFGEYGLMALGRVWITANQIEASRIALTRAIKKTGKVGEDKPNNGNQNKLFIDRRLFLVPV